MKRFFVITGGPGSGKSTLIEALTQQGIQSMPEAGRAIIQDQIAIGGTALPWNNRLLFSELMLTWEMRSYRAAFRLKGTVLFDRGVPDVIGYLNLSQLDVPQHVIQAAKIFRYNSLVFIAPPWPEIFSQDEERKQSISEAEATYYAMREVYGHLGYELVCLPRESIESRVHFICEYIR